MKLKYHQGIFKPKNPEKYKGDANNIIFRSSWEREIMIKLDRSPSVIQWSSEETVIPYISPIDNKPHRYFVDFWVKKKNASDGKIVELLIEVKPKSQTKPPLPNKSKKPSKSYLIEVQTWGVNSAKWKAAMEYCNKRGMQFVIMTEDEIGVRYPTRPIPKKKNK